MAALFLRISLVLHILHSIVYFFPKKIRSILATSWFKDHQEHRHRHRLVASAKAMAVPVVDQTELSSVFQTFDRDGDGRITKTELRNSLENLGIFISESDLSVMIDRIDANGDGCVDIGEFGALYEKIVGRNGLKKEEEEDRDLRDAFDVFDANGDGYISAEELKSVLSSLGLRQGRTAKDFRRMIEKVDEDGDGRVSFMEFKEMMKRGGGVFAAMSC